MRLLSAAKINLHLRIGAVQPSGFHPLLSWFVTIGLFDTLICEPDETGQISLRCSDPTIPTDHRNLIVKAAMLLQKEPAPPAATSGASRGASFHLQKRIPAGGGLGGGSSNAARTIMALNHLWKLEMCFARMSKIAGMLGSDVPFFLHGHSTSGAECGASCICTGRGEIIQPIAAPTPRWALLILPKIAISTAAVYAQFDKLRFDRLATEMNSIGSDKHQRNTDGLSGTSEPNWQDWAQRKSDALLPELINDLEAPAFEMNPELGRLRDSTEQLLGRIIRMSGSGSTLFTLFDEASEAQAAKDRLSQRFDSSVVVSKVVLLVPTILDDLAAV